MSPDFKIGVIALTAHEGGKQPTNAKALNKAATQGASKWAAAFKGFYAKKAWCNRPNLEAPDTILNITSGKVIVALIIFSPTYSMALTVLHT